MIPSSTPTILTGKSTEHSKPSVDRTASPAASVVAVVCSLPAADERQQLTENVVFGDGPPTNRTRLPQPHQVSRAHRRAIAAGRCIRFVSLSFLSAFAASSLRGTGRIG